MNENIFELLKKRKEHVSSMIRKATDFSWISKERSDQLLNKLDNDTLTIGVIGQMKCGKSTFLNSFVFEEDVLPAATTPMTAALSVITYGETKRIVAEFYSHDEWAEQQMQAQRSLEDAQGNTSEESKIKAAKELMSKAHKLGTSLNSYLGKTKEDSFENLIDYVGAEGKYISITKSVTIYYPKDYLKGVEIVDTPGLNDPIVSREERTKDFLKRADVVLMMLYAGRPFDVTDRDIIFKNVRQCGIGKVLIGINKYDIPYCSETNPEDESQIKAYVVEELKKACRECADDTLIEILKETTPIPLSAQMALLSQLPMAKINNDSAYKFDWNRYCNGFGISTQAEMRKWSHIDDLIGDVKTMVEKEKDKILFSKPINAVSVAGMELLANNEQEIQMTQNEIELLQLPDDEIEERDAKISKAKRKIEKKISTLGDDIEAELRNIIRKGKNQLEDDVDSACNKMSNIVENDYGRFTNFNSKIAPKLNNEIEKLTTRTLQRSVENIAANAKRAIDGCVSEFFADAEDILMRYIPDFDTKSFVKKVKSQVDMKVTEKSLFSPSGATGDSIDDPDFVDFVGAFMNGATFGLLGKLCDVYTQGDDKAAVLNDITSMRSSFDAKPYLDAAMNRRDEVMNEIKDEFISELIVPLQTQLEKIKTQKANKSERLDEANKKLNDLKTKKAELSQQISEIEQIKSSI